MIENTKSSILSFALWTENSPIHNISSILYLEKSNSIVTGSESGHIIIWKNKSFDNQLLPMNYMITHRSKIISLCLAGSRKHTDIDYFVSFSNDREIGLWQAGNARSIEFQSNSPYNIQSICSFESENMKQRLLFCCLTSPEIVIINSMSLTELCTLTCTNSLNQFSAITTFNISTKDDIILASTESGLTSMWILNFGDINNDSIFNPKCKASESIKIDLSNPSIITQNQSHTNIVLIISACGFVICYAKSWDILCYQNSHRGDYFIGGEFISINRVLVHCKSGKSLCYKLSPRSDFEDPLFGQASSDLLDDIPHLLYQFKEPQRLSMLRHQVTTKISENRYTIWKGFVDGSICKWDFYPKTNKMDLQVYSLSSSWKKMIKKPSNLANMFEDTSICGTVTSLLYLSDLSLFVLGMHNGSIFITNFETSVGSVFIKTPPKKVEFIKLVGHHGPVLCLMHPCSTLNLPIRITSCNNPRLKACLKLLKLTYILWSGGEDFTLRIWNIKTQQCLNVFNCHSAPIMLLKLNHLPDNGLHMRGFSQGITAAMLNSVKDNDTNSGEIRQLIKTCMNSFMIVISEDGGISIFSVMKRKLLLYSIAHDSPVKRVGWLLDCGYVLLETISDTVYVWDLSSRSMDRYETGETAQALMGNDTMITRLRSQSSQHVIRDSHVIGRHSFSISDLCQSSQLSSASNKMLTFQFIKTGSSDRHVPVLILHLTNLLDSLDNSVHTPTNFYSLLNEMDNPAFSELGNNDVNSDFDTLMVDGTKVNRVMDFKTSIIKLILSQAQLQYNKCQLDAAIFAFLDMKSDVACSLGQVNSKTGAIIFSLKDLFWEPDETVVTIEHILLQLSISNKITNSSGRNRLESSVCPKISMDLDNDLSLPRRSSSSNVLYNFNDYHSSTKFSKLLLAYQKSILDKNLPMLLQKTRRINRISDFNEHISFFTVENFFNSLIMGILDRSDWINTSAYEILVELVTNLSYQDIQHYLLITRSILLPDLDHYTTEGGRDFSARIHAYLHRFAEQSFLISDWIWWYSPTCIKIDYDKRKLTKIQIKALIYLALIGTYLQSDDNTKSKDDSKLFSKIFSLDNFFLARITCDFLMNVLNVDHLKVKKTKNRLMSLALMCLSVGFTVWQPFLNSTSLICQLFELTDDLEEEETEDTLFISSLAKHALKCIAFARPLMFVNICHREMLRVQNTVTHHSSVNNSHILNSSTKNVQKEPSGSTILKNAILFPILEELCDTQSDLISGLLPEVVELFINCHGKPNSVDVDMQHVLYPVLKFTSVSIHASSGHVSVGSSNGSLALFDFKMGKYCVHSAHLKSITYTLFSNDARHLATYSVDEGMVKIWQISNTGIFHTSSPQYHVKMIFSESVPSIDQMILFVKDSPLTDNIDSRVKEKKKKRRGLRKTGSKKGRPTSVMSNETGLGLNWDTDNRTLSINLNERVLRKFKL